MGAAEGRAIRSASGMNQRYLATFLFLGISLVLYAASGSGENAGTIRYAAIGDSYSIGEGAKPDESWPAVLTSHLREKGIKIELVANPSRTGWTIQNAIDRELPVFAD